MKLKIVVPDMERTFGNLGFAGEGEVVMGRINGQRSVLAREYHLFSDIQRTDDVIVRIPGRAGEKRFEFEDPVKLVNPRLVANGRQIRNGAFVDYVLEADDLEKEA